MKPDEIDALVSDWARTFNVSLTAVQHMGLQLALRDKSNQTRLGCMHVNLRTAGTGMVCLECGAYLEFHAG
jgi:hypothetical protein